MTRHWLRLILGLGSVCAAAIGETGAGLERCAKEGETCRFTGTRQVLYGANDKFAVRTLSGGAVCGSAVFGDPVPSVAKNCYLVANAGSLKQCADQGQKCSFAGRGLVIYASDTAGLARVLTGGALCGNQTFGDPAPNAKKTCAWMPEPVPSAAEKARLARLEEDRKKEEKAQQSANKAHGAGVEVAPPE
jgi:hypothetical protein